MGQNYTLNSPHCWRPPSAGAAGPGECLGQCFQPRHYLCSCSHPHNLQPPEVKSNCASVSLLGNADYSQRTHSTPAPRQLLVHQRRPTLNHLTFVASETLAFILSYSVFPMVFWSVTGSWAADWTGPWGFRMTTELRCSQQLELDRILLNKHPASPQVKPRFADSRPELPRTPGQTLHCLAT